MSSTTIRVTPTSRGNFSKLRKYKDGNSIEKYETPANTMHKGVTFNNGTTWGNTIFSTYEPDIFQDLQTATTPEQKQAIIKKYNDAQTVYAKLRPQFTDLSKVSNNQEVTDYQNLINTKFAFVVVSNKLVFI